jgi:DNA-binding winged helix-turn-helix (wHTH) protein/tetratricopeptide (TPR) repeat protein
VIYVFGEFELDLRLFELRCDAAPVPVQPKVLDLLTYLLRNRDRVVPKQELLDQVWPNEIVSETALTHAVMEVRRAVQDDGSRQQRIQTVRRRGYRFVADVEERAEPAPARRAGVERGQRARSALERDRFIGRERALGRLRENLESALSGRSRVVLLVGEPGIGKTRTAEELAAEARAAGAETLVGRSVEGEGAPAYWPWVQIVRAFVGDRDRDALEPLLGARAAVIAQAIPEVREKLGGVEPPPELEPAQARFRLFDSLTSFLRNAARERPLVLVIDDLHRADRSSLLLLQFLVREVRDARILVVGTYRDAELARDPRLARVLGAIVREDPSRSLQLDGLDRSEVARFIEETTGRPPPQSLVTSLWEQTGGNPFFLRQVVQLLEDEGRLDEPDEKGSWEVPLSQGVREAIRRHLDVLSEECRAALAVAAVVGREFPLAALRTASDITSDALLARLGEAMSARIVSEVPDGVGQFRFSHSLIRETLYGELPAAERVKLHRRVGEALVAIYGADPEPHLAELAHHFVQAAPGGAAGSAIEYSVRAAQRATAQLAYEQAVAHYERALAALPFAEPDERRRCEILIALGAAHWRAAEGERARERYLSAADVARALGEPELMARAAVGFGVWDQDDIVDEVLVRLLEESLDILGGADSALRARVMGRLGRELRFTAPWERLEALSQGGVDMARRVGDTTALAETLVARHWALWGPENTEDRFAAAVEIVQLAEEIDNPVLALQGRQFRLADLLELGDIPAVDAEIDAITWLADELQRPQHQWFALVFRAMRAHMNGRFEEAEQLAGRAHAIGERVHRETAVGWYGVQTAALRRAQGRLEEAAAALQVFRRQFPWVSTWRCELTLTLASLGREAEARAEFDQLAARDFSDLRPDLTWLVSVAFLAEACALLGEAPRAKALYDLLRPHESRTVSVSPGVACYGSAARYLGLLATTLERWEDALAHFEAALAANSAMGAGPYVAATELDRARMLAARGEPGDRESALQQVGQTLQTARELGMGALVASARELQRSLQKPARRPPRARTGRSRRNS